MTDETTRLEDLFKDPGIEAAVLIPNLLLLLVVVLYLLTTKVGPDRVQALVVADSKTTAQIRSLERQLARNPRDLSASFQLAHLYMRAGQLPFSYDALRGAEQDGSRLPSFRMMLGMAYVEIGKNADGQRVLHEALEGCTLRHCRPDVEARLSILSQVVDLIVERRINARIHPEKAAKIFGEVLKKVDGRVLGPLGKRPRSASGKKVSEKPGKKVSEKPGKKVSEKPGKKVSEKPGEAGVSPKRP